MFTYNQIFSLSGIIKLVYNCIQWKLNVSEYVAMRSPIVFPVKLLRINISARFKTLKYLSTVAAKGDIASKIFNIQ